MRKAKENQNEMTEVMCLLRELLDWELKRLDAWNEGTEKRMRVRLRLHFNLWSEVQDTKESIEIMGRSVDRHQKAVSRLCMESTLRQMDEESKNQHPKERPDQRRFQYAPIANQNIKQVQTTPPKAEYNPTACTTQRNKGPPGPKNEITPNVKIINKQELVNTMVPPIRKKIRNDIRHLRQKQGENMQKYIIRAKTLIEKLKLVEQNTNQKEIEEKALGRVIRGITNEKLRETTKEKNFKSMEEFEKWMK